VLAGLVAGGLTASTAFAPYGPRHAGAANVASAAFVAQAPSTVPAAAALDADAVGALRVQEAAIAEWEYRTSLPVEVSRATNTPGSMVRPARGAMTGWWGEGRRSHRHSGIDFDGDTGDRVVSAGSGTVAHAGQAPSGYAGYGLVVIVDHGNGVSTLYAHLSRIRVASGQRVAPGDDIGAIGTTGNVTGSHLHFEVRLGGRPVNPAPWVAGA
jgi:murein DD-endopeptidase MepM/ murein hydrolase activator NlpD